MSAARSETTDEQRRLATVLRDLAWTIHRLVPEVADLDPLPNTELAVAKQVLAAPGITVTEIAHRLGMQQSNVSTAVRALVARGLVDRERAPEDRRIIRLSPTEKSRGARESIDDRWSGTVHTAMAALTPDQVKAIENAEAALEALDEALHNRPTR